MSQIFVSWDALRLSSEVDRHTAHGDAEWVKLANQRIEKANRILVAWVENSGGTIILLHGDEGHATVDSDKLEDLPSIKEQMGAAWEDTCAFGVGTSLEESGKALKLALKRGGSIIFYTPDVDKHLKESEEKKPDDKVLDQLASLDKASPSVPSVSLPSGPTAGNVAMNGGAGGFAGAQQGPAAAAPNAPMTSASEHSQGEAAVDFFDEHNPPSVSATNAAGDLEGQFHAAASEAERDNAMAQANQAVTREGGGENPEKLKQQIVSILSEVKEQQALLEQLKEQAPDVYKSIIDMVNAMVVMAKELFGGQPSEKPEGEPAKKSEEPLEKAVKNKTIQVELDPAGKRIKGALPEKYAKMPIERIGAGQDNYDFEFGYNESAFRLGDGLVLKLTSHRDKGKASEYLRRISRLKQLKLSHVVPIIDHGIYGTEVDSGLWGKPSTRHITYEIMKAAHPLKGSRRVKEAKRAVALDELNNAGYYHDDAHFGNIMQDTLGRPKLIDLESILPGEDPGERNYNLKDGYQIDVEDKLPKRPPKWAKSELEKAQQPGQVTLNAYGGVYSPRVAVTGALPGEFAGMKLSPVKTKGMQDSTYFLGNSHVLKVQHHPTRVEAAGHLRMLARLKKLNLSHVVPIVAHGHFGAANGFHYTYEIMPRLQPAKRAPSMNTYENVTEQLNDAGWGHTDMHDGNFMRDKQGNAKLVDLEGFYQHKGELEPSEDISTSTELDKNGMCKLELPMPHAPTHHHLNPNQFPPGSQKDGHGQVKIVHTTEGGKQTQQWREMRAGKVMAPRDGHAVSSRNPSDR